MGHEQKLKIWLIREGEESPLGKGRLHRAGALARYLSEQGHTVTWWSSTFHHWEKRYLYNSYQKLSVNAQETLILLHSKTAYKKNISPARIIYHQNLAWSFRHHAEQEEHPDIILCSWPTTQFAKEAIRYGKRHNVPVVIDIRDLWPDIFVGAFPEKLQGLARFALLPWDRSARRTLRAADAIVGVMPNAVEFGCSKAGRAPAELDKHIFIGCERIAMTEDALQENLKWWSQFGISEKTWNLCFFSSLGKAQDLKTAICAVKLLSDRYPDIRLVIGGKGDMEDKLKSIAAGHKSILFAGWLNQDQMSSMMYISKCGMYSYKNDYGFQDAFSNKAIQYLAGGLPILTSLTGFSAQFVREHEIGETYTEDDANSCAQAIERVYLDEPRRQKMAARALEQFEKTFESTIVNQQFEEELYRVMDSRN